MLACFGLQDSKVLVLDMRSPGQPVAELSGHQAPLGAIAWGAGGTNPGSSGGGWIASCGTLSSLDRFLPYKLIFGTGDDSQLLLYDLTQPLPADPPSSSTRPSSRHRGSRPEPSPNLYTLSPPTTPAQSRNTPSPSQAVELLPSKSWTADTEVNNLAFSDSGEWLGCVSGSKLNVLRA